MTRKPLVLIVEDDPAGRLLATATLEGDGFAVVAAGSAEKALEQVARQTPDLILMDIQLPGMDGLELTRKLKADPATAGITVIALTAHTMPLHERAALAAGCAGYIAKPVSPAVLSSSVRTYISGRRPVDHRGSDGATSRGPSVQPVFCRPAATPLTVSRNNRSALARWRAG